MKKIDDSKFVDSEVLFTQRYGEPNSEARKQFENEATAYYYGTLLKEKRKILKLTQRNLADRVGTTRSYIARIEKGETNIQLSTFLRILTAMNLTISIQNNA